MPRATPATRPRSCWCVSNRPHAPGLALARGGGRARSRSSTTAASAATVRRTRRRSTRRCARRACEIVCLAGYMRLLTPFLVAAWQGRMLNIHPSLLPAFPGLHTHARRAGGRREAARLHRAPGHRRDGRGPDPGPGRGAGAAGRYRGLAWPRGCWCRSTASIPPRWRRSRSGRPGSAAATGAAALANPLPAGRRGRIERGQSHLSTAAGASRPRMPSRRPHVWTQRQHAKTMSPPRRRPSSRIVSACGPASPALRSPVSSSWCCC